MPTDIEIARKAKPKHTAVAVVLVASVLLARPVPTHAVSLGGGDEDKKETQQDAGRSEGTHDFVG